MYRKGSRIIVCYEAQLRIKQCDIDDNNYADNIKCLNKNLQGRKRENGKVGERKRVCM